MRAQLLTNLFLLIIVIPLGAFLFLGDNNKPAIKILSNISADTITSIKIYHNQREVSLNKSEQIWSLTSPMQITANQFRIKTLLNLLKTESYAQYNIDDLDLIKYGFDPNATSIKFNDTKFDFGIINPMNNYRYVKTGDSLHLIDDHFYPLLSSQIGTLVARELLPKNIKIQKIALPENTFTRDENKLWQSEQKISSDVIANTIYHWKHKQAFAVHDYMPRESLGVIQVYFEDSETPILFNITDNDPWLIIARPDIKLEYHFNIEEYDALLRPGAVKPLEKNMDSESLQVSPDEFMNAIQAN